MNLVLTLAGLRPLWPFVPEPPHASPSATVVVRTPRKGGKIQPPFRAQRGSPKARLGRLIGFANEGTQSRKGER